MCDWRKVIVLALVCLVGAGRLLANPLKDVSTNEIQDMLDVNRKQNDISIRADGPDLNETKFVTLEQFIPLLAGSLGSAAPFVTPMLYAIVPLTNAVGPIINRVALQMLTNLFNSMSNSQNAADDRVNETTTAVPATEATPTPTTEATAAPTTETTATPTTEAKPASSTESMASVEPDPKEDVAAEEEDDEATIDRVEAEAEDEDAGEDEYDTAVDESERSIVTGPYILGNFGNDNANVARALSDVAGTLEEFLIRQMQIQMTHDADGTAAPMSLAYEKLKKSHEKLMAYKNSLKKVETK